MEGGGAAAPPTTLLHILASWSRFELHLLPLLDGLQSNFWRAAVEVLCTSFATYYDERLLEGCKTIGNEVEAELYSNHFWEVWE